jgi:hypothetical protein
LCILRAKIKDKNFLFHAHKDRILLELKIKN